MAVLASCAEIKTCHCASAIYQRSSQNNVCYVFLQRQTQRRLCSLGIPWRSIKRVHLILVATFHGFARLELTGNIYMTPCDSESRNAGCEHSRTDGSKRQQATKHDIRPFTQARTKADVDIEQIGDRQGLKYVISYYYASFPLMHLGKAIVFSADCVAQVNDREAGLSV
jgi:hypothetical protein